MRSVYCGVFEGVQTMTKILLVDDEELILYSLSKMLRHGGADVTTVTNGKGALREMQGASYDLCFLDVQLPDANGLELMKTFRELSPKTSIIIMTALGLTNEQQHYLHNQNCLYLPKPFELDQVQSLVSEITGKHNIASGA
jgi:two-component system OmpR family response regulator